MLRAPSRETLSRTQHRLDANDEVNLSKRERKALKRKQQDYSYNAPRKELDCGWCGLVCTRCIACRYAVEKQHVRAMAVDTLRLHQLGFTWQTAILCVVCQDIPSYYEMHEFYINRVWLELVRAGRM